MFSGPFGESIIKRARERDIVEIRQTNFRDYAKDKHKSVDDTPYGGGPGMVLMCNVLYDAVEDIVKDGGRPDEIILLSPQGQKFDQKMAKELSQKKRLLMIAGHYEGFDERIRQLATMEVSIGDFVLSGGELPAMVLTDAIVRLLPGALGDETSTEEESFSEGLLEYPQYTRPAAFRGMKVPDVLLSGHHENIRKWRIEQSLERTKLKRPDLIDKNSNCE